jgi:hypothetical protein
MDARAAQPWPQYEVHERPDANRIAERKRRLSENWKHWRGPYQYTWHPLEDARLAALIAIGAPAQLASAILGRTPGSVELHRQQLRWPPFSGRPPAKERRTWTGARLKRLEAAIAIDGLTFAAAARRLGTTRNSVAGAITRHLPHLRRKGHPHALDAR